MKKKTTKKLPKAQFAGGMGPGGVYPGQPQDSKTPPPRGLTYTEDAAPLREGYTTPQQWVNTWNPKTNSYDRTLKNAVLDTNFNNKPPRPSREPNRMKKGGPIIKGTQLRRQASSKGLRISRKHK
jgi:hypothetical protein